MKEYEDYDMENYCTNCSNTGRDAMGNPCTKCRREEDTFDGVVTTLAIPVTYQGIKFKEELVPSDLGHSYVEVLKDIYDTVKVAKITGKNYFIGSPPNHSKTVLAYSCIQELYRQKFPAFPLLDTGELKRVIKDLDNGKKSEYLDEDADPINVIKAPYLFIKIPDDTFYDTYDLISLIVDRRTRRGNSTILIFNGTWKQFIDNDKKGKVKDMEGDGAFGTLCVKSFWRKGSEPEE